MIKDELYARLLADGQPGLVRTLETLISGEPDIVVVADSAKFSDDPIVNAAVEDFVRAHGRAVRYAPAVPMAADDQAARA